MDPAVRAAVEAVWAAERVALLGSLARRTGDLQLAEDALQDAVVAALRRWAADGLPDRPGAWMMTTAWHAAVDRLRRDRFPVAGPEVAEPDREAPPAPPTGEDTLALVFTCCHPALAPEARVALVLRHVYGLTDDEIAARFLVPPSTMTKRLVRARAKIKVSGIPFRLPEPDRRAERLAEVLAVVYLIFTHGYGADRPAARAGELGDEAVWLAREVRALVPADPEAAGLLALLLLHHSRRHARRNPDGSLVPWPDQDRSRWDAAMVEEARGLLAATVPPAGSRPGPYALQAAIALLHAVAEPGAEPDWELVGDLYRALERQLPSAAVTVARASALARAGCPDDALRLLAPLTGDPRHDTYVALHAARADALLRVGRQDAAAEAWDAAARHARTPGVRDHLTDPRDALRPT